MTDVPFHLTLMGRRYYEATLPALVAAIERLNENIERIASGIAGAASTCPAPSATPPRADTAG